MHCLASAKERAALARSRSIDKQLREDGERAVRDLNLVLLGGDKSGKNTIWKQVKILHGGGFTREDREHFKSAVYGNTIQSLATLLHTMRSIDIQYGDPKREADAQLFFAQLEETAPVTENILHAMKRLWYDTGVQECFGRSNEYHRNYSVKYFLEALDRLSAVNYIPSEQDILQTRVKAAGVQEVHSSTDNRKWTLHYLDVNYRQPGFRRWMQMLEGAAIQAVIFCVDISGYDQDAPEDETMNRLQDSLTLFHSFCDSGWYDGVPIFVLLNKKDLFQEKIERSSFLACFPEYTGKENYEEAAAYIQAKFEACRDGEGINCYQTCALETKNIQISLEAILKKIVEIYSVCVCGIPMSWSESKSRSAHMLYLARSH